MGQTGLGGGKAQVSEEESRSRRKRRGGTEAFILYNPYNSFNLSGEFERV